MSTAKVLDFGSTAAGLRWSSLFKKEFQKFYPGTKIEVFPDTSGDYQEILQTELSKPKTDFCLFNLPISGFTADLAEKGMFFPINKFIPQKYRDQLLSIGLDRLSIGGNTFSIAKNITLGLLFFRHDILGEYGFNPPLTWKELEFQMTEITAHRGKPVQGLLLRGGSELGKSFLEYLWSNGGCLFDREGNAALENTRISEVLEFFIRCISKKLISKETLYQESWKTREDFLSGRSIFYNHNSDMLSTLSRAHKQGNNSISYTFTPVGPHGTHSLPLPEGSCYVVPANCGHLNAAADLVKFLAMPEQSASFYRKYGHLFQRFDEPLGKRGKYNVISDSRIGRILRENRWPAFDILRFPGLLPFLNEVIRPCLAGETPISKTLSLLNDGLCRRYQEKDYPSPVRSCLAYIRAHYQRNFSLSTMSEAVGISTSYLSHLFTDTVGIPVKQFLLSCRLRAAEQNLRDFPEMPAGTAGAKAGIDDTGYFYRLFKKYKKMNPEEFRKQFQQ